MLGWIQWKNIFWNTQSMVLKGETVSPDIAITQTFGMPRYLWSFWTPLYYPGQMQTQAAYFWGTTLPKTTFFDFLPSNLIKTKSIGLKDHQLLSVLKRNITANQISSQCSNWNLVGIQGSQHELHQKDWFFPMRSWIRVIICQYFH